MKALLDKAWLWLVANLFSWLLVVTALIARRRMSHNSGVTGVGRIRIVENPTFPPHDFLQAGREFPCRLRHACVTFYDDAMLDVRAASLKFTDSDWESPLDLEMNSGKISLFWTARNFLEFVLDTNNNPALTYQKYYKKHALGAEAAVDGIRVTPTSFADLRYHSQTPTQFTGLDGRTRYVTWRLIPEDKRDDAQFIENVAQAAEVHDQRALPGEQRKISYLRDEWAERVQQKPVVYHLQLQLHEPVVVESTEIFHSGKAWDEATHPWHDVATVTIERALPFAEDAMTRMSIGHHPPSLGLIPATGWNDYNSLNYMRIKADRAKAVRAWVTRVRGNPQPGNHPELDRR